jgi:acetoin utilization deacetylase AcuC-like enzyme
MGMKLFYSDTFELPLPSTHRFPMAKYGLLRQRIEASNLDVELLIPPAATDQQLLLVHNREYLEKVKQGSLTKIEQRRIGFPWSEKMVERSRRSTGATIAAAETAIDDSLAFNLAGGTHHAFADAGQGFCVFNDVCVAARMLQRSGRIKTALVVDCDVHQGNGTASITSGDPSIVTFSMHCCENFPFKKTESDFDIALPRDAGDEVYLSQLNASLQLISQHITPDVVFYLAGADPFVEDRLGLLSLTESGLSQRDRMVYDFYGDRGIPIATCMAGGYAREIEKIVDIHFQTVVEAAKRFQTDPFF